MAAGRYRLDWNGDQVLDASKRGQLAGLRNAADHWLTESLREVPLRTGVLQDSGVADVDAAAMRAGVSFDTPYAEVQHEREDFHHPNGRKDHYVSDPMTRETPVMLALIAAAVRSALGGAGGGRRRRR